MKQPSGETVRLALFIVVIFCLLLIRSKIQPTFHESTVQRLNSLRPNNPLIFGDLIDPNNASFEALLTLPGLGQSIANKLLQERRNGGDFQSKQELLRVSGIGPTMVDKIDGLLVIENPKPPPPPTFIDLNCATISELEKLAGIGPVIAQRVVEFREQHGPFATNSELERVRGIGPVVLNKARVSLTVKPSDAVCSEPM